MIKAKKIPKKLKGVLFIFQSILFYYSKSIDNNLKKSYYYKSNPSPPLKKTLTLIKKGTYTISWLYLCIKRQKLSLGTLGSIYFDVYQGADFWIDQFDVWIKCLHSICKRIRTGDLILKINENYQFHTNDGLLELSGLKKIILDTKLSMKMKKKNARLEIQKKKWFKFIPFKDAHVVR